MSTMMIGMLLAWGLSAAAMRAALAARDQTLLKEQYQRVQERYIISLYDKFIHSPDPSHQVLQVSQTLISSLNFPFSRAPFLMYGEW
jgi:hypothetical protein